MNVSAPPKENLKVFNHLEAIRQSLQALVAAVEYEEEMFGLTDVVQLSLVALFSEGHVLLEGNPGLGKTELIKALHHQLGFTWRRIQFTPDLMPADITGSLQPNPSNPSGALIFAPGPVFTSLLLADEINRATPKTQAAMLEAMAERQVTVAGESHPLPDKGEPRGPFIVFATQNPIDQEGTYELPEAQADRFMFKVHMPSPGTDTLIRILAKTTGPRNPAHPKTPPNSHPAPSPAGINGNGVVRFKALTVENQRAQAYRDIVEAIRAMNRVTDLETHVTNLIAATNGHWSEMRVAGRDTAKLERLRAAIEFGLGPRAATALLRGSKAWAALFGDGEDADGYDLARVLCPVLRHRIRLRYNWRDTLGWKRGDETVDDYLWELSDACLPDRASLYGRDWAQQRLRRTSF